MKVIVVGNGKVGKSVIEQLYTEGHDITVIDKKMQGLEETNNSLDVLCINGDGIDNEVLIEAGVPNADLVIAVTSSDELNIVCSMISKNLGAKNVVTRIRSKEYAKQGQFIKKNLNIDLPINPELRTAREIANQFKFVGDFKIESLSKGLVEIVSFRLNENNKLVGLKLNEISKNILVCAVERQDDVFIPSGDFKLEKGDRIHIVFSGKNLNDIYSILGENEKRAKSAFIVGAGKITYYLSKELLKLGMEIKIIDSDLCVCENMAELLPESTIIHGDATNQVVLEEEGVFDSDSFVALTGNDEINILLSLYAKNKNVNKVIAKINNTSYGNLVKDFGLTNVFTPKDVITDIILTYVRAIENSEEIAADTVYRLVSNKVEALEFRVLDNFKGIGIPLKELKLLKDIIVAGVVRKGDFIVADGNLSIELNDRVIIISFNKRLHNLNDIIR